MLNFEGLVDPTGVLLITRDPLRHAQLFSKFLSEKDSAGSYKNARIIQTGDARSLAAEEQNFVTEVMQAQQEAAQFYRQVRVKTTGEKRVLQVLDSLRGRESKRQRMTPSPVLSESDLMELEEFGGGNQHVMAPASIWSLLAQGKVVTAKEKKNLFIKDCAMLADANKFIPAHSKNDNRVRIATYNVHMWLDPHGGKAYEEIMKVIGIINADILVLQEVEMYDSKKIEDDFVKMGYQPGLFLNMYNEGGRQFGNMVVSKYPFARKSTTKYFTVDEQEWEKRGFIHAVIALPNKQEVSVYGTHLDVFDTTEKRRVGEIKELLELAQQEIDKNKHANVVLVGDFNAVRKKDYQYTVYGENLEAGDKNLVVGGKNLAVGDKRVWDLLVADNALRKELVTSTDALELVGKQGFADSFARAAFAGPKFTVWPGTVVDFLFLNKGWQLPVVGSYVYYSAASDHLPVIMDVAVGASGAQEEEKQAQE